MKLDVFLTFIGFLNIYGYFMLGLIIIVTVLIIVLGVFRLTYLFSYKNLDFSNQLDKQPLVSIHLPICNEPPNVVLDTIESIISLNYTNFELLVISNNTSDINLWKPIEQKIQSLDKRFKFIHKEKVYGYKAGALNLALEYMNKNADYIFTIDSDYNLHNDALHIAVSTIQENKIRILQFPQSYRNTSTETEGLEVHYRHYFDCYLSSILSENQALPTGTLTIIDAALFAQGYSWPTDSITEDASFGVDMKNLNRSCGYCNKIIGQGIMPIESRELVKQNSRWVFGNFQVLIKTLNGRNIHVKNKIHFSILLFAWMNLLGLILITLLFSTPLIFSQNSLGKNILFVGFIAIVIHGMVQFTIFSKIAGSNIRQGWKAYLIHLSLLEIGSFYWMSYLVIKEKPFIRTSKFLKPHTSTNKFHWLPLSILFVSLFSFIYYPSYIVLAFTCFALLIFYAKYYRNQELQAAKLNLNNILL